MSEEIIELEAMNYSSASQEELFSAIDDNKLIYQIITDSDTKQIGLCMWGHKIGYFSYYRTDRNERPWEATWFHFRLENVDCLDYDDMTTASELFDFDANMPYGKRIEKWRCLYSDSLHWKLSCSHDDFCEEACNKLVLCKRLHYTMSKNKLNQIYIIPKGTSRDMLNYAKRIMAIFLDEQMEYISEWRGLD